MRKLYLMLFYFLMFGTRLHANEDSSLSEEAPPPEFGQLMKEADELKRRAEEIEKRAQAICCQPPQPSTDSNNSPSSSVTLNGQIILNPVNRNPRGTLEMQGELDGLEYELSAGTEMVA